MIESERTEEDAKASAGGAFPVCSFGGLVLMLSLSVFSTPRLWLGGTCCLASTPVAMNIATSFLIFLI
jgi:hypothetical protein